MNRMAPPGVRLRSTLIGLVVVGSTVSLACDDGLSTPEPEKTLVLGAILTPDAISVPDTVTAGARFEVTVRTWQVPVCSKKGHTEVTLEGNRATVTPYDTATINPRFPCPSDLNPFEEPHRATLSFPESGRGHVTVRGREEKGTSFVETTFERTVVVR